MDILRGKCEMAYWIFHRLFKMPLSMEDVYRNSAKMLNDLKWFEKIRPDEASYILEHTFGDGITYQEHLLKEIIEKLKEITAEKTWEEQRKKLLVCKLNSMRMLAIADAVYGGYQDKIKLWEHLVKDDNSFRSNDQKYWSTILLNKKVFSSVFSIVYDLFGDRVYGVSKHLDDISFYIQTYQMVLEHHFSIREFLNNATSSLSKELIEDFEILFVAVQQEEYQLLDEMAADISNLRKTDSNLEKWKKYFMDRENLRQQIQLELKKSLGDESSL